MPKFVKYAVAALFCFIVMVIAVYAFEEARYVPYVPTWQPDMYVAVTLNERQQGLDIKGEIPELSEEVPDYATINNAIFDAKNSLIEGTRRIRARRITFGYEIFYTDDIVSIVIMADSRAVTDRTSVASVNFRMETGQIVDLTEAMGMDITPLAEGKIADMIRRDPSTYYAAFTAPPTGQAFYLTEDYLVLLFDEFQLSSVPDSTRLIQLVLDNIKVFTISYYDYRISQDRYEIKMMPLRLILTSMGYNYDDIVWNPSCQEAIIMRDGYPMISLTAGENNFQINGVMQRSLEAAPELKNHTMYVPISFFDQILGLTAYDIDEMGNITFMTYVG